MHFSTLYQPYFFNVICRGDPLGRPFVLGEGVTRIPQTPGDAPTGLALNLLKGYA